MLAFTPLSVDCLGCLYPPCRALRRRFPAIAKAKQKIAFAIEKKSENNLCKT